MELGQQKQNDYNQTQDQIKNPNQFGIRPLRSSYADQVNQEEVNDDNDHDFIEAQAIQDPLNQNEIKEQPSPGQHIFGEPKESLFESSIELDNSISKQKNSFTDTSGFKSNQNDPEDSATDSLLAVLTNINDRKAFKILRESLIDDLEGNLSSLKLRKFKELQEQHPFLQQLSYDQFRKSLYNSAKYIRLQKKQNNVKANEVVILERDAEIQLGKRTHAQLTDDTPTYDFATHFECLNTRTLNIFQRWCSNVPQWENEYILRITKIHPGKETYNNDLNDIINYNTTEVAMAYVRQQIGASIQRDSDISFDFLTPLAKLNAWLNSQEHRTQIENCILSVGSEFTTLSRSCQIDELVMIGATEFASYLLAQMFNSCYNSPTFQCNTQFILLMIKQGVLRKCVLKWINLFNASKKIDQRQLSTPKGITDLVPNLKQVLTKQLNFSSNDSLSIIQNPDQLLWDDLLLFLKDVESRTQLLKITNLMCDGRLDPTMDVKECNVVLRIQPSVYSFLLVNEKYKLVEKERIEVVANVQVASIELDETATVAFNKAQNQLDCLQEYNSISNIADQFQQNADGEFVKIGGLILYSARACSAQTKCVYAQLDQGNVLNKELQKDVQHKLSKVKCKNVSVIVQTDLQVHFKQPGTVFIFDEFYSALTLTELKVFNRQLNPIFELGLSENLIISTGHRSNQFSEYLLRYFGSNITEQKNISMKSLLGMEQNYNVKSKSFPNLDAAQNEAIQFIRLYSQSMPIICFGVDWKAEERFGLGADAFIKNVQRNLNDLENLQLNAPKYSKGVIGLPLEYGTGIDVRFKVNAYVVIVMKDYPRPEQIKQMIARGTRNMGDYGGSVFYVGNKEDEEGVQLRLERCDGDDFQDGADIILCLRRLAANTKVNAQTFNDIVKTIGPKWMTSFENLKSMLKEEQFNLIEEVLARIKTERQHVQKKKPVKGARQKKVK